MSLGVDAKNRVLIVDTDPKLRKTFPDLLKARGYPVVTAATGKEALDRVKEETPAVVVIDVKLEDISGLEVIKEIKGSRSEVECVVLTGYDSQKLAIEAVNSGAYGYIREPYDMEQLLVIIRRAIEKREMEEALRESEQRTKTMLASIADHVSMVDKDLNIIWANDAAKRIFGDDIAGKRCYATYHGRDKPCEHCITLKAFQDGKVHEHDMQVVDKDGKIIVLHCTASVALSDNHGKPSAVIEILRDITEQKKAEEQLERSFIDLAETVSCAMDSRDPYTAGHQRRVAYLASLVGEKMGLDNDRLQGLYIGGLLHDIGKISTPEGILTKPGKLTKEEWSLIRAHAQQGYDILKDADLPWPVAEMALHHHERLDGSGYPDGISGDELSLEVRILAVCDVVDAMSSYRPYRPARSVAEILEEIRGGRGTRYDAGVVDIMLEMIEDGKLELKEN